MHIELIGLIIFIFVCLVWGLISVILEKHKQNVRNKIAHELLDGIDLQKETQDVLNLNKSLNFISDTNRCPYCGSTLIMRRLRVWKPHKGHGGFLTCIDYPKCSFSERIY
jgi:hypothetical protein